MYAGCDGVRARAGLWTYKLSECRADLLHCSEVCQTEAEEATTGVIIGAILIIAARVLFRMVHFAIAVVKE